MGLKCYFEAGQWIFGAPAGRTGYKGRGIGFRFVGVGLWGSSTDERMGGVSGDVLRGPAA